MLSTASAEHKNLVLILSIWNFLECKWKSVLTCQVLASFAIWFDRRKLEKFKYQIDLTPFRDIETCFESLYWFYVITTIPVCVRSVNKTFHFVMHIIVQGVNYFASVSWPLIFANKILHNFEHNYFHNNLLFVFGVALMEYNQFPFFCIAFMDAKKRCSERHFGNRKFRIAVHMIFRAFFTYLVIHSNLVIRHA